MNEAMSRNDAEIGGKHGYVRVQLYWLTDVEYKDAEQRYHHHREQHNHSQLTHSTCIQNVTSLSMRMELITHNAVLLARLAVIFAF